MEYIIENFDKSIEFINEFIKNKLENSLSKDPIIMKPLNIKKITYELTNNIKETVNIEEENQTLIRQSLFNFLQTLESNQIIKRKELIFNLNLNMSKNDIWNKVKNILNWSNGKTPICYNNKKFYIHFS